MDSQTGTDERMVGNGLCHGLMDGNGWLEADSVTDSRMKTDVCLLIYLYTCLLDMKRSNC